MKSVYFALALTLSGPGFAAAQSASGTATPQMPETCEVTSQSEIIRLVHCASAQPDEVLADVGRAACDGQIVCGVWIWYNREDVPIRAPENHDGLAPEAVASAAAVWSHEISQLVTLEQLQ